MIDVDRFKDVNTKFCNLTGERGLADHRSFAEKFCSWLRRGVSIWRRRVPCHFGGHAAPGAAKVYTRIRAYLLHWNNEQTLAGFELSLSIGVFRKWSGWHDFGPIGWTRRTENCTRRSYSQSGRSLTLVWLNGGLRKLGFEESMVLH